MDTDSRGTDSRGTDSMVTDSMGIDSMDVDSMGTDSRGTASTGTDSTGTDKSWLVPRTVRVGRLLGPVASDGVEGAHVTLVVPLCPAPRLVRTIEVALLLHRRPSANLLAAMLASIEVTSTLEGSSCPQALH